VQNYPSHTRENKQFYFVKLDFHSGTNSKMNIKKELIKLFLVTLGQIVKIPVPFSKYIYEHKDFVLYIFASWLTV
jgi:hypothetical protein